MVKWTAPAKRDLKNIHDYIADDSTLADSAGKPITVSELARNINDYFWYRRKVSEGAKGPIVYEFTRRQVKLSADGLPGKTVWLLIRRTIGSDPEYSYFISNASTSVSLKTLVWLSGLRWAIEQCFEELKTELGMDHCRSLGCCSDYFCL